MEILSCKNLLMIVLVLVINVAWVRVALAREFAHVMVSPGAVIWADTQALPTGAKMAVLEGDLGKPGPFAFRLKFPVDFRVPPHWHQGIEHVTVLAGTYDVGMGEALDPGKTSALPVGGFVVIPPKTPHFAWTKEETIIQVHGVGPWGLNDVNPADDPRKR